MIIYLIHFLKIGFIDSLITLPKDSIIDFKLFKEDTELVWDSLSLLIVKNWIWIFWKIEIDRIELISKIPDGVTYTFLKEKERHIKLGFQETVLIL